MIADVLGKTIDFSKIVMVGEIGGDPAWLRYEVYFVGKFTMSIYENRHGECFPRNKFIELWKKSANNFT